MASRREQLEAMLAKEPNDCFLLYALALEHINHGSPAAGAQRLRDLLAVHADYVPAYFQLGQCLAREGSEAEARQWLQKGIEVARRVGDAHALGEMTEFLESL